MKNLVQLSQELKRLDEVISKDPKEIPYKSRAGWEAARNQARAARDVVVQEFREAVLRASYGIFLRGDAKGVKELADFAQQEGNAVVVDAARLYERAAEPINKMLGVNRVLNVSQASRLIEEITEAARDLQVAEIANPLSEKFPVGIVLKDRAAVVDFVRQSVRDTIGDSLNMLSLEREAANQVADDYGQNIVPVIVLNATEQEVKGDLFKKTFLGNNFLVTTGPNGDTNKIVKVFNKIKAQQERAVEKPAATTAEQPEQF